MLEFRKKYFKIVLQILFVQLFSISSFATLSDFANPGISLSNADALILGEHNSASFGSSVASAGDVNGDGYDDILVGCSLNYSSTYGYNGDVFLFYGSPSITSAIMLSSKADVIFWAESYNDYAGSSVSGAGDVNGDGYDDILIGAPYNDDNGNSSGKSYIIYGSDSLSPTIALSTADVSLIGENAYDYSGSIVSKAGDVNGDGYDDILIGAYSNDDGGASAGKSYLIYGSDSLSSTIYLSLADASFVGENASDNSGSSLSSAGDVNGDGYDDILIGASSNSDRGFLAGKAYLIYGSDPLSSTLSLSTADVMLLAENRTDFFGTSVSSAGDVNGDGFGDIIIGASCSDTFGNYTGKTYIFYGSSSLSSSINAVDADVIIQGELTDGGSGNNVSYAGDINNDGYDDVLISAWSYDLDFNNGGKAYLIEGSSSLSSNLYLSDAEYMFIAEGEGDMVASSLSYAGDVDGDGFDDILIGSSSADNIATSSGAVYLITQAVATPCEVNANAGIDGNAYPGTIVKLDGSASTASSACSEPLTYSWTISYATSPITDLSYEDTAHPAFTAGSDMDWYLLTLTVESDGVYDSDSINIYAVNNNPVADAGADIVQHWNPDFVILDGSGSYDFEDGTSFSSVTWRLHTAPSGSSVTTVNDPSSLVTYFNNDLVGVYLFVLEVTDSGGKTDIESVYITITNNAPVSNNVSSTTSLTTAMLNTNAYDPDGDPLTLFNYQLISKPRGSLARISGSATTPNPSLRFSMDINGVYVIQYKSYDGRKWSNTATISVLKNPSITGR